MVRTKIHASRPRVCIFTVLWRPPLATRDYMGELGAARSENTRRSPGWGGFRPQPPMGVFYPQYLGHPILTPLYLLLWHGHMNYLSETGATLWFEI